MTNVNSSDVEYSLIEEVTAGTTPTAVGTRYHVPLNSDASPLVAATTEIPSNTKMKNRSQAPTQSGMLNISGSLPMRLRFAPVVDMLLSSALSGKWESNKLKAGQTDTFFSVITEMKANTATGEGATPNGMFYVDAGVIVTGLSISGSADGEITASFDVIGTKRTEAAADHARPLTALPSSSREFTALDATNFTIGSETIEVASFEFNTSQNRSPSGVCGSKDAAFVATEGARSTTLVLKAYRSDFTLNALADGTMRKISFEVGDTSGKYRFTLHGAIVQIPTDERDGANMIVSMTFSPSGDATEGTDLTIEKI